MQELHHHSLFTDYKNAKGAYDSLKALGKDLHIGQAGKAIYHGAKKFGAGVAKD